MKNQRVTKAEEYPANFIKIVKVKSTRTIDKYVSVNRLQSKQVKVCECFHSVSRMLPKIKINEIKL